MQDQNLRLKLLLGQPHGTHIWAPTIEAVFWSMCDPRQTVEQIPDQRHSLRSKSKKWSVSFILNCPKP